MQQQQQPQPIEDTVQRQQLRYDNDGVCETYDIIQDVACLRIVEEHVAGNAQQQGTEDPARAEKDGKGTKAYLRKRHREASTKKAKKRCTPGEAKKRRTSREAKKRKLFDPNTMAYAEVLKGHIDGIVRSQCLGCMINSMDHHDICEDPPVYVNKYFQDAMMLLDDAGMEIVINDKEPGTYISKTVLLANIAWCERVKEAIISLF